MKIVHVSDPHMLAFRGVPLGKLLSGKRALGYANIALRRGRQHRFELADAVLLEIQRCAPDHIVVTGDVSNLGLEAELAAASQWLRERIGLDPNRVSVVPGNHDTYTPDAFNTNRFARHFGLEPVGENGTSFPFVKLLGPVAIIGLDSSVPQPPFIAAGRVSERQLRVLRRLLADPSMRQRLPVILVHHPVLYDRTALPRWLRGLRNARELLEAVQGPPRVLFLHGHLHRWVALRRRQGPTEVLCIGAASASRASSSPDVCAGFNVLEIDETASIRSMRVHSIQASGRSQTRDVVCRTFERRWFF